MKRIVMLAILGLLAASCGGGVDTWESALDDQLGVMEEMVEVLEGVTDEASARAAVPEIEALGKRFAALVTELQELPLPEQEKMQDLAEAQAERQREFQENASRQLAKLGDYPELSEAFVRAMSAAE